MDNVRDTRYPVGIGAGITSLVTIFMVLLLTTFSVLSLVSARYDWKLTEQTFTATADYYTADYAACEWLSEIEAAFEKTDSDDWTSLVVETSDDVFLVEDESGWQACRSFSIDQRRELLVGLKIRADGQIEITRWVIQTIPLAR